MLFTQLVNNKLLLNNCSLRWARKKHPVLPFEGTGIGELEWKHTKTNSNSMLLFKVIVLTQLLVKFGEFINGEDLILSDSAKFEISAVGNRSCTLYTVLVTQIHNADHRFYKPHLKLHLSVPLQFRIHLQGIKRE